MLDPSPIDVHSWATRQVEILDLPLDEYARAFVPALEAEFPQLGAAKV
jgi:hypothetical protein